MGRNPLLGHRAQYVVIGILLLFPLLALTSPTTPGPRTQSDVEKRDEEECGFSGDDNTYGLGIRIGLYFQWVTSSVAYNFVPDEATTMRGVNNCFQAAMFAGLLFITITKGSDLYAVEAFMMLIFCMGGVCSGETTTEGGKNFVERAKKYAHHNATKLGGLIRFLLGALFCGYGMWFTFKGMDNMKHPPCSTYAFFIVRVNLYNWFRTFWKIMFTLGTIIYGFLIIGGLLGRPSTNSTNTPGSMEVEIVIQPSQPMPNQTFSSREQTMYRSEDENQFKQSTDGHSTLDLTISSALILFIVGVEMMIKWNHISGVGSLGSTGQLLPLIIGVGGMGRVLYAVIKLLLNKHLEPDMGNKKS